MSRLLLIAAGQLTGAVLEAVARSGAFDEIVLASRSLERARAKANNARVGTAIEGQFPRIDVIGFDLNDDDASARLAEIAPDVGFIAPSLMPWWALENLPEPAKGRAATVPFGGFVAFHLAPLLKLRDAWVAAGLECPWVNGSYPDVVNAVLHATGEGPACGVGNIVEAIPKVRFTAAEALGTSPADVEVKLVAQHALEYFFCSVSRPAKTPPFLLKVTVGDRDVTSLVRDRVFEPFPIPYELDFNLFTASAANVLLPAFLGDGWVDTHVPGPDGLVGGYPVRVSRHGLQLCLPPEWSREQAAAINRDSLAWEGIAEIGNDGKIHFTDLASVALGALLGRATSVLVPADAPVMAAELLSALVAN